MSQNDLNPDSVINNKSYRPVLLSLSILISGIIIGAGITLLLTRQVQERSVPPGPEYMSKRTVQRIARELNLSVEQREQLSPIIEKHMKAIDQIRREARPQINELLTQMNEQILSILNEEQKIRWQESVRRMQEHFSRMRNRRGPRDGRNEPGRRGPDSGRRSPNEQQPRDPMPPKPMPPLQDQPVEPIAAPPE